MVHRHLTELPRVLHRQSRSVRRRIAQGAMGAAGVPSGIRAQQQPTPPELQQQQLAVTPTQGIFDQIIGNPPTSTPPSSGPPTPTPGSFAIPPTEPVPPEATTTVPAPEPVTPTPTSPPEVAPPVATEEPVTQPEPVAPQTQFPCGTPGNPFGWLCWPGPIAGPWLPVFPSREVTNATGIHWYGLRMSDPYVDTQASETGWMLESVAWTLDGQEVSRCAMGSRDGLHRWALANGEIGFAGEFSVTTNAEGVLQYSGSIYEGPSTLITGAILEPNTTSTQTPYTLTIGGMLEPSVGPLSELTLGHADLVAQWVPFYHDLAGLLDIAAPGDGGEVAGPGKCAAAGAMTAVGCLATASTVLFGYFVCDDIAEAGLDWCKD